MHENRPFGFEIEDLPILPATLRDHVTDFLRFVQVVFRPYHAVLPLLRDALERTGATQVIDLCSGGAGPIPEIAAELRRERKPTTFVLTDYFPNVAAFERVAAENPNVSFVSTPVDAAQVPQALKGFRTLFTSFHHFGPEKARWILEEAVRSGEGIGVFEVSERRVVAALRVAGLALLAACVFPFLPPFNASRMFWSLILPAVPFIVFWDGVVSHLRSYTPAELSDLVSGLGEGQYSWHIGQTASVWGGKVTFLIGTPVPEENVRGFTVRDAVP